MVRNMGQFMYSKCKVPSLLWFAHFGMRIGGVAQLLSCPHILDHTKHYAHFLGEFDGSKISFGG